MMRLLMLTAALLLTGCGAPAEATPTAIEEDDPRWECLTMGNKVCGSQSHEEEVAAWAELDSTKVTAPDKAFKLTYLGKGLAGVSFSPDKYHTIPAGNGYVHVFGLEL